MTKIVRKKQFAKQYKKRILGNSKLEVQFERRFALFYNGERGHPLNDHALTGNMAGKRSFSITGDVRVIYEETADAIIFLDIGTHAQVYE